MNDETSFEAQLRGRWTPRRPARRIERRLFGQPEGGGSVEAGGSWRWLAPATGVALVSFLTLGMLRPEPPLGEAGGLEIPVAVAGSNLARVGAWVRVSQSRHNYFGAQRFEWTSSPAFPSSIHSPGRLGTNNSRP